MGQKLTRRARALGRAVLRHPVLWVLVSLSATGFLAWDQIRPTVVRHIGEPLAVVSAVLNPRLTDHVIIISVDGLRPDAITRFDAPTLQALARAGRYTFDALTITPSRTLPSHVSMLTGTPPEVHGITWNTDETEEHGRVTVPTIFETARRHGLVTAAFFSKTKFEHLAAPAGYDFLQRPRGGLLSLWADQVGSDIEDYLEENQPNLLFVHIADADFMGHRAGWMGYLYGQAVEEADAAVADIIAAADASLGRGEYTLIVTADHGGYGRDHGDNRPENRLIPWIVWGNGVAGTGLIEAPVNTMDTAATALWLLGVDLPAVMTGTPVRSAFNALPLTGRLRLPTLPVDTL